MLVKFTVISLALVVLAGCASNAQSVHQAVLPLPGAGSNHRLGDAPALMPTPHLLTSIDATDRLGIAADVAAPFLTIGHTSSGPTLPFTFQTAGINAIPYTDINHYIPGDKSGTNVTLNMSDVALTCDGQYVQWVKPNHPLTYLTDPRKPGTIAAWEQWYTNFVAKGGAAWAVFEDTTDKPFGAAYPASPCNAAGTDIVTQAEWTAASEAKEGAMQTFTGKPVIFNGLSSGYNKHLSAANDLLDGPVAGGESEMCAPADTTEWVNQVTIEIHAVKNQKYFVCHNEDKSDGSTPAAIAFRQYQFTTMMLDYDLAHTVYESYFAVGPSNLRVQPESEVVMQDPYIAVVNSPADLLGAGGAYVRQYHTCYVAGALIGECADIVNPTAASAPYPFPTSQYKHSMLLRGSGLYDGATVSATGPAPASMLSPNSGEVVFL